MARDVLEVARGELGNTESPAGSNRTRYGKWMGLDGQPWCMSFVQWCYAQAGTQLPFRTGSCSALLNWYRKNLPECVVTDPQPRDIIIYNFGHTGILESTVGTTVTAVEGNTSAGASGSQDNGGGVFRRTRSRTLVTAYIRPFAEKKEDIMNGKEILAALSDEQAYELVTKAQNHASRQPVPSWAKAELEEAKKMGITDGSNPMQLIPRYQAVILAKRAAERK